MPRYPRRNIHPMIYVLITNNYATLYELSNVYDMEEALDLYEICMCSISNKNDIIEDRKR